MKSYSMFHSFHFPIGPLTSSQRSFKCLNLIGNAIGFTSNSTQLFSQVTGQKHPNSSVLASAQANKTEG